MSPEKGGHEPSFTLEQVTALGRSAETLQILRTIAEPRIPGPELDPDDDLPYVTQDAIDHRQRVGKYISHLQMEGVDLRLQVRCYFNTTSPPELLASEYEEISPSYGALRASMRATVNVSDEARPDTLMSYLLWEVVEPGMPLDGGVVIIGQRVQLSEGFEEFGDPFGRSAEGVPPAESEQVVLWFCQTEDDGSMGILDTNAAEKLTNLLVAAEFSGQLA